MNKAVVELMSYMDSNQVEYELKEEIIYIVLGNQEVFVSTKTGNVNPSTYYSSAEEILSEMKEW